MQIPEVIEKTMAKYTNEKVQSVEKLVGIDREARLQAEGIVKDRK